MVGHDVSRIDTYQGNVLLGVNDARVGGHSRYQRRFLVFCLLRLTADGRGLTNGGGLAIGLTIRWEGWFNWTYLVVTCSCLCVKAQKNTNNINTHN